MEGDIPFRRDFDPPYGELETVAPMVRRIVARNPGPFTFRGTGTYVVGHGEVAVIDPGPLDDAHVDALLGALDGERITHLLVTHTHRDHSPACRPVQAATGAPAYGFGPHGSGRVERGVEVEEGADRDFDPDVRVGDGDVVEGAGWSLECVHTPGHTSNHLCFALRGTGALFCGDHVMGWNTTIVSPPDGDMGAYVASLRRLLARDDAVLWPTHGAPIESPRPYLRACIAHRRVRETQIRECLHHGLGTIDAMVPRIYDHLPQRMYGAAARSVLATLVWLVERGEVECEGVLGLDARFTPAASAPDA